MALGAVEGRGEEALAALRCAEALEPGSSQAAYQTALLLLAAGELAGARACLLRVHERSPREPGILVQLGSLCKRMGRTEEAARFLNLALEALSLPAGLLGGAVACGPGATASAAAAAGSDKDRNTVRQMLANLEVQEGSQHGLGSSSFAGLQV
jgi:tetratricopeptide (TPR) repeat protein